MKRKVFLVCAKKKTKTSNGIDFRYACLRIGWRYVNTEGLLIINSVEEIKVPRRKYKFTVASCHNMEKK